MDTERERGKAREHTKALGFGPVPWRGVVWKEERLWERNRLHLNILHFLPLLFRIFLPFLLNLIPFLATRASISLTARHLWPCMQYVCVVYILYIICMCVCGVSV